jgi:septal ring factor EnvC (AmiA/AmiB activator)
VLAAVFLVAAGAFAQERSREDELAAIRSEIAGIEASLASLDERAEDLAGRVRRTDLELALQTSRVAEATAAYALAEGELADSEERIGVLSRNLDELRTRLRRRLVSLYRLGGQGYLRFLLRRDARALREYREAEAQLESELEERERRRVEAERWLASERERRRELDRLRREQARLLAEVERRRETLAERTLELQEKARRLENLIALLYAESATVEQGTPIQEFRGVLDWPVLGDVVVGFGPREDPRYGTQVPHNGIELATEPGESVRVVFSGTVLFADPFEGFGFTAVVHHADRVFTLYAGLDELSVAKGDVLSLGDRVGRAGSSLYFEVRLESRPEDPLDWLR